MVSQFTKNPKEKAKKVGQAQHIAVCGLGPTLTACARLVNPLGHIPPTFRLLADREDFQLQVEPWDLLPPPRCQGVIRLVADTATGLFRAS